MNDLLHDTVFGQMIRLFFRKRLLKFPDEVDSSLWKQYIRGAGVAASSTSGHINDLGSPTASIVEAMDAEKEE